MMYLKINKKSILVVLLIFALVLLAGCDSGSSPVDQNQTEAEANQTIEALNAGGVEALDEYLADDFTFNDGESNQETTNDINTLKDKYFNSGDKNLEFRLAEDGTADVINNQEIEIYTQLIITIDFSLDNTHEYKVPVVLTLEKIDQEWKITSWEERQPDEDQDQDDDDDNDLDDDDDQDDEEDDLLIPEDRKAAESKLDQSLEALENEDTSTLSELWAADFEYENSNSDIEFSKEELIAKYEELFAAGRKHTEITLINREYDYDSDEIEIYGLLTFSGVKSNGEEYTGKGYYAKFELEKINDSWLISEWEENSSNFEDDEDDEEQDDLDDEDEEQDNEENEEVVENAEDLLDEMLDSIENENAPALENYLADNFEWSNTDETLNKEETISGFSGIFNEGRYYDEYDLTEQQIEYISENKVKISGLLVIKGLNGDGNYFEEIEENQATFTLEKVEGKWYVTYWEEN